MEPYTRIHGLDAVRGGALLLGVLLHASMSFLPGPQVWVVVDAGRSMALSVTFFTIHVMRMTVFFLLAGFFGRMALEAKGVRAFTVDRSLRIGIPLLIGWPIVLFSILVISAIAAGGSLALPTLPPLTTRSIPLTHLWFLYVLVLFYPVAMAIRSIWRELDRHGRTDRIIDAAVKGLLGRWAAVWLALPVAAALYLHPYWFMWFGIPTPDRSLYPNRAALVAYGLAFALGWLVHRQADSLLPRWRAEWKRNLVAGVAATAVCLAIAGPEPLLMPEPQGARKLGYAMSYAVALWSLTFFTMGLGLQYLSGYSAWRRYLADASYWIYLAHLPLVMALQWMVAGWPLPWVLKLPVILGVAMGILLLSYDLLVRPTFVGALLNGRRQSPVLLHLPGSRIATSMRISLLLLLVLPTALHAQSPAPPAPLPLDTVLARYAAAVGPVETLQTRRTTMRVSGMAPFDIPVVVEAMRPNRIRKEVTIQGSVQISAYDGSDAWRIDPFVPGGRRPMDLPASELPDLIEEADFEGMLLNASQKGYRIRYSGPAVITVGSRQLPVHSLAVVRNDGRSSIVHLDARSFLEIQRVDTQRTAGRDVVVSIIPSAYRRIQGVAVPHLIEIAPEGLPTPIRVVVERVELGVELDARRFTRPGR
jgi:glucans biosynthesis protein C